MKTKRPIQINNRSKLEHLTAQDMFLDDAVQVFDSKKGNWIGTIRKGETAPEFNFEEPQEVEPDKTHNPNQISLF